MCLGCIICTDEARLVLSCWVLRLAKRETTVPPHTLYGTNFLDGVLEPIKRYDELVAKSRIFTSARTGFVVADNPGCYTFEFLVRCDTIQANMSVDSYRAISTPQ
jgi:hypothetical protein